MVRGKRRDLSSIQQNNAILDISIHNRFDIEVIDSKNGYVKQRATAFNTVCAGLWSVIISNQTYEWPYCIAFGSGNGSPSYSDTDLFSQLGSKQSAYVSSELNPETSCIQTTRKIKLTESEYVGSVLTEVGTRSYKSVLCTHATLKDMNGNSISISKTDTDIINIYVTIFLKLKPEWFDKNNDIQVIAYDYRSRLGFISGACAFTKKKDSYEVGNSMNLYSGSLYASTVYDVSNKKIIETFPRLPASKYNLDGGYLVANVCTWEDGYNRNFYYPFLSALAKNWYIPSKIIGEAIGTGDGTTVDFSTAFNFPKNAIVYVDGIVIGATVEPIATERSNSIEFLYSIDGEGNLSRDPIVAENDGILRYLYFNQAFASGIQYFTFYGTKPILKCSNDLSNWISIPRTSYSGSYATHEIPEEYAEYKYWSCTSPFFVYSVDYPNKANGYDMYLRKTSNIHFDTPPSVGAVITADYTPGVIAKDENHVFDFSLTIQLGEYTGT